MKRGLTYSEAMDYAGVKRRTFDAVWRPRLKAMRQGSSVIFDRADLDRLFDQLMAEANDVASAHHPDDAQPQPPQNDSRNERPNEKGMNSWAEKRRASTPAKTVLGRSTNGGKALDFASVASSVLKKRKAG